MVQRNKKTLMESGCQILIINSEENETYVNNFNQNSI